MMDSNFLAYLQFLEIIAFFSGYPLIFAMVLSISDSTSKNNRIRLAGSLLPFSYALIGALYLGLQLKNFYPDYSITKLQQSVSQPWLMVWALLSILFFIPALARKKKLSLFHSLVFFYLLVKNLFLQVTAPEKDIHVIKNVMRLYTSSLILNFAALFVLVLLSRIPMRNK